jgi:hypothetical protein
MRVASQIWQVVFASQTLLVFCLALHKKAQYVIVVEGDPQIVNLKSLDGVEIEELGKLRGR